MPLERCSGDRGEPSPPGFGSFAQRRPALPLKSVCRLVRQVVSELVVLLGERVSVRRDHRRLVCHSRQIAMYVCHVALQIPQADIGTAFGRDRSTVGHACHVVEDRRDDPAFDDFVAAVERIVVTAFGPLQITGGDPAP